MRPPILAVSALLLASLAAAADKAGAPGEGARPIAAPAAPLSGLSWAAPGALRGATINHGVQASGVPSASNTASPDTTIRSGVAARPLGLSAAPSAITSDQGASADKPLDDSEAARRVADVDAANRVAAAANGWTKPYQVTETGENFHGRTARYLLARTKASTQPLPEAKPLVAEDSSDWRADKEAGSALRRIGLGAMSAMAGYEMLLTTMSPYLKDHFADFSLTAELTILGTLGSMLGHAISAPLINRFSLKGGYARFMIPAATIALAIGLGMQFGTPTVLLLFGAIFAFRLVFGLVQSSDGAMAPIILRQDRSKLERFLGWKQQWLEAGSTWNQVLAGSLLAAGAAFSGVVSPFALNLFIAFGLMATALYTVRGIVVPAGIEEAREADRAASPQANTLRAALAKFGADIKKGTRLLRDTPAIKWAFVVSAVMMAFNICGYLLIIPAFAYSVLPATATGAAAGPVIGLIAGLFSFGGIFAGQILDSEQARLDGKTKEEKDAFNRSSTLRWLAIAAASTLLVGVLALPIPAIAPLVSPAMLAAAAAFVHLPAWVFLPAAMAFSAVTAIKFPKLGLALVLLPTFLLFPLNVAAAGVAFLAMGLVHIVTAMKMASLVATAVPRQLIADAQGAVKAYSFLSSVLALIALKFVLQGKFPFFIPSPFHFDGFKGAAVFAAIGVGAAGLGALLGLARTKLARLTQPKENRTA